jgi:hypothetical protein
MYPSRSPIAIASIIYIAGGSLSLLLLIFAFFLTDPDSGMTMVYSRPLWHVLTFLRAIAMIWFATQLWRYQTAIRRWAKTSELSNADFGKLHTEVWTRGTLALCMFLVLAIIEVVYPNFESLLFVTGLQSD